MALELARYGELDFQDPPNEQEREYLDLLPEYTWSGDEVKELNSPVTEEEVLQILKFETNLDSAPGEDGITSRALLSFWRIESFRWVYSYFF